LIVLLGVFCPAFIKLYYGLAPFGSEWGAIASTSTAAFAILLFCYFQPLAWGDAVQTDNLRRKRAYNLIGRMIVKPGIEVKEVLKFVEKSSGEGGGGGREAVVWWAIH